MLNDFSSMMSLIILWVNYDGFQYSCPTGILYRQVIFDFLWPDLAIREPSLLLWQLGSSMFFGNIGFLGNINNPVIL